MYGGANLTLGLVAAGIGSSLASLLGIVPKWQELCLFLYVNPLTNV
ncbi:MAG: hypothetical protein ACLQKA_17650 [Bryobacteraceae bacterium]